MTKRDFELIASVLATVESEIEEMPEMTAIEKYQKISAMREHARITIALATEIKKHHPRFKPGTFEAYARPIYSARVKKEILNRLKAQNRNA
jgi:hypothetical protein